MINYVSDVNGDIFNIDLDISNAFSNGINASLQLSNMGSQRSNLIRDSGVLGGEFFLLVFDFFCELFLNFDGCLINLRTRVDTFFSLFFKFFRKLVLDIFNLFVDVRDLFLNVRSFLSDNRFSDLLIFDLLLDKFDSLFSFLRDS